MRPKRALISVYDKTGIVEFARALVEEFGIEIISTGGTAALLRKEGIPVTLVEEITGFPEMLDGRVKTLHPKIHAAILADRDNPEHMRQLAEQGIQPIDMVVVNLYPFEETVADPTCTFEQAIEMIDIGGPCLLRAAAKNHKHVIPVADPDVYNEVLDRIRNATVSSHWRLENARMAFIVTYEYDSNIEGYLGSLYLADDRVPKKGPDEIEGEPPLACDWDAVQRCKLRYGENPHQKGWLYEPIFDEWHGGTGAPNLVLSKVLQGEMSFNNYLDADAALRLCADLGRLDRNNTAVVIVKHTNACGVCVTGDPVLAFQRAYLGDPKSALGGILALSKGVNVETAAAVMKTLDRWGRRAGQEAFFLEVWLAPAFEREAIITIRELKGWGQRVRLIAVADLLAAPIASEFDFKKICGGMLVQNPDIATLDKREWKHVTKRIPTLEEREGLSIAWLIAKHTKSNAISICKDGMLIGNGAGQMSRVMSCRIATWLAQENGHADKLPGSVAASDAFFPFADGPKILMDAGVTAMIQPGGSKRDADTIAACDERGVAMIFTGIRHFRH